MEKTAIVCGGGIGGLSCALALSQQGWHVTVLEQAKTIKEVGAGIQLSANAAKVLTALGLLPAIEGTAFKPKALQMRNGYSGKLIAQLTLNEKLCARWGGAYYNIHRADLLQILLGALDAQANCEIVTDFRVRGYSQTDTAVTVFDQDKQSHTAAILIGADGIHSIIREQMLGKNQARFSGNIAWRLTVPTDRLGDLAPPETAAVWFGKDKHAVSYRLRKGELCNFVGVVETAFWQKESWSQQGSKTDCLNDFAGWHPSITRMIEAGETFFQWALMDRPALDHWQDKRVVLLGDACHPMLPFMAQGAAIAIEDSMVLSRCLANGSPEKALAQFVSLRKPRSVRVQQLAKNNTKLYHQKGYVAPLYQRFRLGVGSTLLPSLAAAQFDWLYGYDATSTALDI